MKLRLDVTLALPAFTLQADVDIDSSAIGLFGPSGAGKTTLLEIIAGIRVPDHARIAIDGREIAHLPARERRIGYVPQDDTLFPHMSVRGNVLYGAEALDVEVLKTLEIESLLDRTVAKLSGGERRRVAIARALLAKPALLLLDEPLSGLDNARASLIIEMLQQIATPILFVSHNRDEIAALCDATIVLDHGVTSYGDRRP
ncbi:MAG TPA: ATP-binding cassette domain-containing protein [Thermoanaerobaculia bacterium]|nr:ATP-binding cassette domain-containing protein [Thermoanaerobaculia bacterium]